MKVHAKHVWISTMYSCDLNLNEQLLFKYLSLYIVLMTTIQEGTSGYSILYFVYDKLIYTVFVFFLECLIFRIVFVYTMDNVRC